MQLEHYVGGVLVYQKNLVGAINCVYQSRDLETFYKEFYSLHLPESFGMIEHERLGVNNGYEYALVAYTEDRHVLNPDSMLALFKKLQRKKRRLKNIKKESHRYSQHSCYRNYGVSEVIRCKGASR